MRGALMAALLLTSFNEGRAAAPQGDADARARAYFTDTPLVDSSGRRLRFYSDVLAGKVVLLGFVFTRCTTACPLLVQKLKRIEQLMGEGGPKRVRVILLSVDPEFDTPERLAEFAARHRLPVDRWRLLTGAKADVEKVVKRLGQHTAEVEAHSTAFIAGNVARHHWSKVRPDATPLAVARLLEGLMKEGDRAPSVARAAE